jgi:hypothetical protein
MQGKVHPHHCQSLEVPPGLLVKSKTLCHCKSLTHILLCPECRESITGFAPQYTVAVLAFGDLTKSNSMALFLGLNLCSCADLQQADLG